MKVDVLDVLDAAYTVDGTERAWLERLCSVMHEHLGEEDGVIGFPYQILESGRLSPGVTVCFGLPPPFEAQIRELVCGFPPAYVRETFARYPSAIATQLGTPEALAATRAMFRAWTKHFGWPWRDFMIVNGLDATGEGLYLGIPLRTERKMSQRWRTLWDRIATHLAAAHRLRRRLSALEAANVETADAILSPSGKVEHAVEAAATTVARRSLREAARVIDRSRTRSQRRDPDRVLAERTGLVSARWTLLDHFEKDGKRFILARRNDAQLHGVPSLTERERQALGYATIGHTNKLIAYEMGISASTVGVLLHRAATKLRARSRSQLIERYRKNVFTRTK